MGVIGEGEDVGLSVRDYTSFRVRGADLQEGRSFGCLMD